MDIPVENFDPKPKRKNDDKRKGPPRRTRLFLITSIVLVAIAGLVIARPRFLLMTDAPKYDLLYLYGIPSATYRVDFQTGERTVVDIDGTVRHMDPYPYFSPLITSAQLPWHGSQLKEYDTEASLSPNGRQVVYMSNRDGYSRVYIMDLLTGESRLITPDHDGRKPQWSPDGKWIAFEAYYRSNPIDRMVNDVDVYIVRADGAYLQRVSGSATPMETLLGWGLTD